MLCGSQVRASGLPHPAPDAGCTCLAGPRKIGSWGSLGKAVTNWTCGFSWTCCFKNEGRALFLCGSDAPAPHGTHSRAQPLTAFSLSSPPQGSATVLNRNRLFCPQLRGPRGQSATGPSSC